MRRASEGCEWTPSRLSFYCSNLLNSRVPLFSDPATGGAVIPNAPSGLYEPRNFQPFTTKYFSGASVHFDSECLKKAFLMCQALQQEKHVLQRKMDMNELAFGQREAELAADLAAAKAELERHHTQGRDRRRDECSQLSQLSSHNQRLVEQLAEVSLSEEPPGTSGEMFQASLRQGKKCSPAGLERLPCEPLSNPLSHLFIFR